MRGTIGMGVRAKRVRSTADYRRLTDYLKGRPGKTRLSTMSFSDVEKIIGARLQDHSRWASWWSNEYTKTNYHQVKSWTEAGWRVREVDTKLKRVVFERY